MRTRRRILAALVLSALALMGVAAPASAVTRAPSDTSDFTFDSFDAVYELSRDDEGRSRMTTTETLVAVFPSDQNRGILRDIPTTYQGHTTQVHIVSITDEAGNDRDYETSYENDSTGSYLELAIGVEEGEFAPAGPNTYVITYTQKDVTLDPADSTTDEFFWDVNGTGWQQPFGRVSATLTVSADLADELNGDSGCYYGPAGSTSTCDIVGTGDGSFTASTSDLPPLSNMSIAVGFAPDTFAPARFELAAFVNPLTLVAAGVTLLALIGGIVARVTALRDARGTGVVIAQYEPQPDLGMFLAANIVGIPKPAMGSAIVDLAVRGKARMIERPKEGLFASGSTFGVQYLDNSGLIAADDAVMSALFSSGTDGDNVRWLAKADTTLGTKVVAMTKQAAADALSRGLRRKPPAGPVAAVVGLMMVGFVLMLASAIASESQSALILGVVGTVVSVILGIATLALVGGRRPLTREGALAKEHLEGLREYIRLAEADRLRMLQSVEGAERIGSTTRTDGAAIVQVYETLLPYAILFGLEKEWAGELAKYYDETPPDWYSGGTVGGFQVAAFAAGVSSFSTSTSSSYSGSASSSSSGGSSGGGSSGGGGGGGGGGGF